MAITKLRIFPKESRVRVMNPEHPKYDCVGRITKSGKFASEVELTHKGRTHRQNFLNSMLIAEPEPLPATTYTPGSGVLVQDALSPYFLRRGIVYGVSDELVLVNFGEIYKDCDGNLHKKYHQFHLDDVALLSGRSLGNSKGYGSLRG